MKRKTGPIERELREGYATWQWACGASTQVWWMLIKASLRLGSVSLTQAYHDNLLPDVFSEAIEAAAALNL